MAKTQTLSIFLLKKGETVTSSVDDENGQLQSIHAKGLPSVASFYLVDSTPKPPWWRAYFGIQNDIKQVQKAAIAFIPVEDRLFAVTLGHSRHKLKDSSYEHDFGLLVTLNCLDREKLKSTDVVNPEGARRQRTQMPTYSDLNYFDIDQDATIFQSLTAKVKKEYEDLFTFVTGSSNIRISSKKASSDLPALCKELLYCYNKTEYLEIFTNILPEKDPKKISKLNSKLLQSLTDGDDKIVLSVPEILDFQNKYTVKFYGAGKSNMHSDVYLKHFLDYISSKDRSIYTDDVDFFKKYGLQLIDENGNNLNRYNILRCLIYDTNLEAKDTSYHLCDGKWYRVSTAFLEKLENTLNPICKPDPLLPNYKETAENDYNVKVSESMANGICLDKENISVKKEYPVEPCDILKLEKNETVFYHIKRSTRSANLSHLFNQGINSLHLLLDETDARENLRNLVLQKTQDKSKANSLLSFIENRKIRVMYGIISHKDPNKKSRNLPLFSRISLMRICKEYIRLGVEMNYGFIKHEK